MDGTGPGAHDRVDIPRQRTDADRRGVGDRHVPRSKVRVPPVPDSHVPRPSLSDRISRMVEAPVTLVSAPAGYGKTQTLADWVRRTHGAGRVAWVTVDRDDDAGRLWAAIVEALAVCTDVPADSALRRLPPLGSADDLLLLTDLVDALERLPHPVHLVIDDLHEVNGTEPFRLVERLVRHQPRKLRLVFASRLDPPLPLARLRIEGRLAELRADDLRFSTGSARELLHRTGIELDDAQVELLVDRTEGWAAGIRLAAMSLQRAASVQEFFDDFAGEDQAVADYLVGEVLSGVPDELRAFLRTLSIGDEMPTGLAVALSGRDDAGRLLVRLERETALVTGAGPGHRSFRVHTLLRTYLAADLEREQPGEVHRLHRAAARWYADAGDPVRALEHAVTADAPGLVGELLHDSGVALLLSSEHAALERSLLAVPPSQVQADPWLSLLWAMVTLRSDRPARAEAALEQVRATEGDLSDGDLQVFRSLAEAEVSALPGWTAVPDGPAPAPHDPALLAWARADRGRSLLLDHQVGAADDELDRAMELVERHGLGYLGVRVAADQAMVSALAGDYPAMVDKAHGAITFARTRGLTDAPPLAAAHIMCAVADITAARPGTAVTELAAAQRAARHLRDWRADRTIEALGAIAEVDARAAHPDRGAREELLAEVRRCRVALTAAVPLTEWLAALTVLEFAPAVHARQSGSIREILDAAEATMPGLGDPLVMRAYAQLAAGSPEAARATVGPVVGGHVPCAIPSSRVDAWLVLAGADLLAGRTTTARRHLVNALTHARPCTVVRPFRYADPRLVTLLIQHIGTFGRELEPLVDTVVRHVAPGSGSAPDPELTDRELTVLTLLQSHRSIDEIARDLTVSANTVKTHVRSVYSKLGVNSRRQAVVAARERCLV